MKNIFNNLWQSQRYSSGILNTHAYVLEREQGNILFYNTGAKNDLTHIESIGGISLQLLTHRDEVGASQTRIKSLFGNKLGISELEAPYALQHSEVDFSFTELDDAVEDISIIHTPGHTDGSICYFYQPPHGKSYLFTGDTFFLSHGQWSTFVLESFGGSNIAMIESLLKLRRLSPDVVLSSGFIGEVAYKEMTQEQWFKVIDEAIAKLKS